MLVLFESPGGGKGKITEDSLGPKPVLEKPETKQYVCIVPYLLTLGFTCRVCKGIFFSFRGGIQKKNVGKSVGYIGRKHNATLPRGLDKSKTSSPHAPARGCFFVITSHGSVWEF